MEKVTLEKKLYIVELANYAGRLFVIATDFGEAEAKAKKQIKREAEEEEKDKPLLNSAGDLIHYEDKELPKIAIISLSLGPLVL